MRRIHQAMRIDMYNNQTFADQLDFLVACNWMLATATSRQVGTLTEDLTTARTSIALNLIGEYAGEDWWDFCRVEHGAQDDWGKVGTGKWDSAIAKYGPEPTPSGSDARQAVDAIYEQIKSSSGVAPSSHDVVLGCNRLLFGGTGAPLTTDKRIEDRVSWIMHDRILDAAGADWPDFCRVHMGPDGEFKAIGTGKWDAAMKDR